MIWHTPKNKGLVQRNVEEEKKYKKAIRFIYKYGQETNKLTEEAAEACKRQGINYEDLMLKSMEDFSQAPNQTSSTMLIEVSSPARNKLKSVNPNLSEVRYKHHEQRRRSKYYWTLQNYFI